MEGLTEDQVKAKKKEFYDKYIELCKEYGLMLSVMPTLVRRDENGLIFYVTKIEIDVVEME